MSLLRYEDFCISFGTGRREKFAVNHLDLEIGIGERVALVGESGSGKTLTALAPLRLEPEGAKVSGKILWNKKDCLLYTSPSPRDGLLSRMPSSA